MNEQQIKDLAEKHGAVFGSDGKAICFWPEEGLQAFSAALRVQFSPRKDWKGCPSCFGSGGKRTDPCKNCNGTGKIKIA